jgi:hypothetical protein
MQSPVGTRVEQEELRERIARSTIAVGAVRSTARRVQPCGSSKPSCPLLSWKVSSIDQRSAYQVSTCSAVAVAQVE